MEKQRLTASDEALLEVKNLEHGENNQSELFTNKPSGIMKATSQIKKGFDKSQIL